MVSQTPFFQLTSLQIEEKNMHDKGDNINLDI